MVTIRTPQGLGKAGRALWRRVAHDYELSPAELAVLERACRTMDLLARIDEDLAVDVTAEGSMGQVKAHPLLMSVVQLHSSLSLLLRDLALPMPDEPEGRRRSPTATAAAQARWRKERGGQVA
jgi:hypothetical protein